MGLAARGAAAAVVMVMASTPARAEPEAEHSWADGDHLTGDWGGARTQLGDHGISIDVVYASDLYTARGQTSALGHLDAALTFDTGKLGLWDGGTFYVLGQNNHGSGINGEVGSAQPVTNLEAMPYTQLTELFIEQQLFDQKLKLRVGKQDANREFGTPRFGGNFINNNFGMFPNAPLPSYPTTGLGIVAVAQPVAWMAGKAAIFEGSPQIGGFGLTNAFRDGAGYTAVASVSATHHEGADDRHGGTTSLGAWRQTGMFVKIGEEGQIDDPSAPRPTIFGANEGVFFQHDERIFLHPADPNDPRGLTVIVRYSWARPDRSAISRYAGGSVAWHGVGPRTNDTVGIGIGSYVIAEPLHGSPGPASETFVEAFYKLRLTNFVSLQPDVQFFRHPGGDGDDAFVAGVRLKAKL